MSAPAKETSAPAAIEFVAASIPALESVNKALVVENVNWSVHAGDYWVVGALPGTGKSDLLATAAGLQKPVAGEHLLFGHDAVHAHDEELARARRRVGLVFENGGRLFNQLTIAENLALPICYHRNCSAEEAGEQVDLALELAGLNDVRDEKPIHVMRNLHQRIGLARALALEPDVLLLDNPLTSMDPRQTYWWLEFLAQAAAGHPKLGGKKLTLVVATDDLRPWTDQGQQFAVISKKQWLRIGGRVELCASQEPILRELLAADFAEDTDNSTL